MAEALLKKAEKEKSRWFVSEETKTQNAADYIEQAGNIYKSQKQHKEAAECFIRAAALKLNIGRAYESAGLFKSAGIQLKIVGDPTATQTLGRAVQIYSELGKGSMAAKLSKELGEGSERAQEYEDAALHFQQAADLFKGEGSDTHARQCLEKVAQFSTMTDSPDYLKAAGLFEEIGVESLSTRLGRFNARKYFFRSVLCTMASGDCIGARAKHSEFMETDYQFGTSREGKFLNQLITALEEMSGDKFSQAYRDYVEISPLDPWHTAVLRQAQKEILGEGVDESKPRQTHAAPSAAPASMTVDEFVGGSSTDAGEPVPNLPEATGANAESGDANDEDSDDGGGIFS